MPATVHPIRPRASAKRQELEALVLKDFRRGIRRRGWTIEQAARECGSDPTAVTRWLSGERRLPAHAYAVVMGMVVENQNGKAA